MTKVSAEAIKGEYLSDSNEGLDAAAEVSQQLYDSVQSEAKVDIVGLA